MIANNTERNAMARFRNWVPVLFLLASPAFAGWSMTQVITNVGPRGDGGATTQKVWMEGNSAKIEFLDTDNPMLRSGSYLLLQDGGSKIFLVNPEAKTYSRFDIRAMTSGMDAMGGSGMEMTIEDPKVEKLLEEPGEEMFGHPTTHYRYRTTYTTALSMPMGMKSSMATDSVEDIWTTPAIEAGGASAAMAGMIGGGLMSEVASLERTEKATLKGLPLKQVTVTTSKSTSKGMMGRLMGGGGGGTTTITMAVEGLTEAPLPPAIFQIPAGYSETEILQRGPAMPDLSEGDD